MEDVPAHGGGVRVRWSLKSLPTPKILEFCEYWKKTHTAVSSPVASCAAGQDVEGRNFWSTITTMNIQAMFRFLSGNASIKGKQRMVQRSGVCFLPAAGEGTGRAVHLGGQQ